MNPKMSNFIGENIKVGAGKVIKSVLRYILCKVYADLLLLQSPQYHSYLIFCLSLVLHSVCSHINTLNREFIVTHVRNHAIMYYRSPHKSFSLVKNKNL